MTDSVEQKAIRILNVLISTPFRESEPISREFNGLPSSNAIYAIKRETEEILYVGKTGGLRERFTGGHKAFLWAWIEDYAPGSIGIVYVPLDFLDWLNSLEIEALILQQIRPRYNSVIRARED